MAEEHDPSADTGTPAALLEHAASSGIDYEKLLSCIHCGICLSSCPTFDVLGNEGDSPRGRIYLMRALAEGRTEINPSLVHHLDTCLDCRTTQSCGVIATTASLIGLRSSAAGKAITSRSRPAAISRWIAGQC